MGDPRMTEHLGGPESPDKLRERQGRYERLDGGDRMSKVIDVTSGAGVWSVGFCMNEWRRDLPQARFRAPRGMRVRVHEGLLDDVQRLALGPDRLARIRLERR